jgi:hypothetical protein
VHFEQAQGELVALLVVHRLTDGWVLGAVEEEVLHAAQMAVRAGYREELWVIELTRARRRWCSHQRLRHAYETSKHLCALPQTQCRYRSRLRTQSHLQHGRPFVKVPLLALKEVPVSVEVAGEGDRPLTMLGFQLGTRIIVWWIDPEIDHPSQNTSFVLLVVGQIL